MTIEPITEPVGPPAIPAFNGHGIIRETARAMADANTIATAIAGTNIVPAHFRGKPDDLTAAILYGATLGFDPMQAARQVYVVHGQTGLYARAMAAVVLAAGHKVWTVSSTDDAVTVEGKRRGIEQTETSTWTIERAQKAGYTNNEKYRTDPQAMLYAKALSEVCRKIAPDVLNGVYAVEELEAEFVPSVRVERHSSDPLERMNAALKSSTSAEPVGAGESLVDAARVGNPQQADSEPVGVEPPVSKAQIAKIGVLMNGLAITDRGNALAYVNDTIGRTVTSRNELTKAEAAQVIDSLERDSRPVDVELVSE